MKNENVKLSSDIEQLKKDYENILEKYNQKEIKEKDYDKLLEDNNNILQENKKIGNTSEKEDKISHFTEVEKTKYKDYTFKQLNFSNTKHTDINQMNKIKLNPNLKNLDNNMTVSSKKKEQEKNPFDNIFS